MDSGQIILVRFSARKGYVMKKAKLFFINSVVMIATSLVLRIIDVFFNVYISNKIGLAGMGLIQIIMSVFGFSVIVACSGIGLASTRLVAEELAYNSHSGVRKSMKTCLTYAIVFGSFASFILLIGGNFIGTHLLKDTRTIQSLHILAISLPFYSAQCALYGYFTAVRRVFLSSITQILEMGARIGLTVFFIEKNLEKGMEATCNGLMMAATLSEIVAFGLMFSVYMIDKRRFKRKDTTKNNIPKRLFKISLPMAFSSYVCSALVTIKNVMIPIGLVKYGMTRDVALSQFGVISGMVIPIILFPAAFIGTFSSLIVPEITECYRLGNRKKINYIVTRAFQVTLIFTICVIAIFLKFSQEFGMVVYKNITIGTYIEILTPLALIAYLDGITDAMLKGLDQQVASMFFNIFDSGFSILLVFFLLPRFGLNGLLFLMFASKLLNTFLSINKIAKITDFKVKYSDWMFKPFVCSFIAVVFAKAIINVVYHGYRYSVSVLTMYVTLSIVLYIILIFAFGCIKKQDIKLLSNKFKKKNISKGIDSDVA